MWKKSRGFSRTATRSTYKMKLKIRSMLLILNLLAVKITVIFCQITYEFNEELSCPTCRETTEVRESQSIEIRKHHVQCNAGYCSKRSLVRRCGFDQDSRTSKYSWKFGEDLLNISQEYTLQLKCKRRGSFLSFENNFPLLDMYPVFIAIPFTILIEWRQVMDLISSGIAAEQKHEDTLFHRYQVPQKLYTRLLVL